MALLANKCVLLSLSAVLLCCLSGGASAMLSSLPPVNFSIGVQGVVWCKSCRYPGYFAPMDASPLPGAKVYLRCKHGRRAVTVAGESGPGGYFLIQTSQQVSAFTSQQCRVYVPRSPVRACGVPDYPAGRRGLPLKFRSSSSATTACRGCTPSATASSAPSTRASATS
ncbi:unnamed protein product [Miscanthus lutarioriparius]|uniref:Pollen Ole e 1 allergen and extensin family protein n=1 Tax=Miscanthus lutarioriparius TaxID=422564 RepID=A0A811RN74_9POAL|nr:unnamed protein product [Miscanthus lutarioriparius]